MLIEVFNLNDNWKSKIKTAVAIEKVPLKTPLKLFSDTVK